PRPPAVTGQEPPVPPDGGDCVVSSASARAALLAGHPRVSVLAGGVAAWPGELEQGAVELQKTKTSLEPRLEGGPRGGGVWAGCAGELERGAVELKKRKRSLEPRLEAVPTWEELRDRLADEHLTI